MRRGVRAGSTAARTYIAPAHRPQVKRPQRNRTTVLHVVACGRLAVEVVPRTRVIARRHRHFRLASAASRSRLLDRDHTVALTVQDQRRRTEPGRT